MEMILKILVVLTLLAFGQYAYLILSYSLGWMLSPKKQPQTPSIASLAVIVPCRNEEHHLEGLIASLERQEISNMAVEFILVDDHSTDGTYAKMRSICAVDERFRCISLPTTAYGKKAAITAALKSTRAEIILCTDADTRMGKDWVGAMIQPFGNAETNMVLGPVALLDEKTWIQKIQGLELLALMGATAGSCYWRRPVLANGANLAYRRDVVEMLGYYQGIDDQASGDDVELLFRISGRYPGSVHFCKDRAAIVQTAPANDFQELLRQRQRWASKRISSFNFPAKQLAFTVFLTNLLFAFSLLFTGFISLRSALYLPFFEFCLILFGFKCIIDILLLFLAGTFFRKKGLFLYILPQQLIYMFYVVVVGMLSRQKGQTWKGRPIN